MLIVCNMGKKFDKGLCQSVADQSLDEGYHSQPYLNLFLITFALGGSVNENHKLSTHIYSSSYSAHKQIAEWNDRFKLGFSSKEIIRSSACSSK